MKYHFETDATCNYDTRELAMNTLIDKFFFFIDLFCWLLTNEVISAVIGVMDDGTYSYMTISQISNYYLKMLL